MLTPPVFPCLRTQPRVFITPYAQGFTSGLSPCVQVGQILISIVNEADGVAVAAVVVTPPLVTIIRTNENTRAIILPRIGEVVWYCNNTMLASHRGIAVLTCSFSA